MTISFGGVVFDCADPRKLADFWTEATGGKVVADMGDGAFLMIKNGDDAPYVGLQRVPEPRVTKNRAHPDFEVRDRPAEVARLVALGASELSEYTFETFGWTVLTDPEGNEFCVGGPIEQP
jgi:predicted enzyme related to lactoylglutathione lyase